MGPSSLLRMDSAHSADTLYVLRGSVSNLSTAQEPLLRCEISWAAIDGSSSYFVYVLF